MSQNNLPSSEQKIAYLKRLLGIIFIWLLIGLYFLFDSEPSFKKLGLQLIPEILGTIIPFVVIYIFFIKTGIDNESSNLTIEQMEAYKTEIIQANEKQSSEKLEAVKSDVMDGVRNLEKNIVAEKSLWVSKGFINYKQVTWKNYIDESQNICIVAFYFDKWVDQNEDSIKRFLLKDNSHLIIYLPDPENVELLKRICEIIPRHTPDKLIERIEKSVKKIVNMINRQRINHGKVTIKYYERFFTYTMQIFDNKTVLLSINGMCRIGDYNSPYIEIDITKEYNLTLFINGEYEQLANNSKILNLQTWRPK